MPGDASFPAGLAGELPLIAGLPRLALLDAAIRQSHDAIVITTADLVPPGPTIVFVNPAFCAMTGYAADELLGRSPRLLQGPETARPVLDGLRAGLTAGQAWVGEAINYRKDGRAYRVEWQIAPVRTAGVGVASGARPGTGPATYATDGVPDGVADESLGAGPITHFIAVQNDITHRRALEARVRTTNTLEALGRLAGGVAHDFNNLLTVIATGTELALAALADDHLARADLAEVVSAVRRAAGLTRQLLAFGRRETATPTPLDPNAAVRAFEPMLGRLIGPDIALVLALAPDVGRVRIDPAQLDQVLVNLVANARDAMPLGGLLTVTTIAAALPPDADGPGPADADPGRVSGAARARAARADDPLADPLAAPDAAAAPCYVRLSVGDTGVGMDAAVRARMFEPFFTTKLVGQGTGLGLATVYGVVAQHGGQVDVRSAPGRGTTVDVYLPRVVPGEDVPFPTTDLDGARAEPAGGLETLLLVEDERLVRVATQRLLELRGYTVLAARHGEDAVRLHAAHGGAAGAIALVLTDVVMPVMDGPTLVGHLRAAWPAQKVVYVSGYTGVGAANGGVAPDAQTALVEKPFAASVLARVVRELLDRPAARVAPGAPA